ncbi:MAG: SLBB domain-containing protein, partial [Verrucomicrobiota bacterium]
RRPLPPSIWSPTLLNGIATNPTSAATAENPLRIVVDSSVTVFGRVRHQGKYNFKPGMTLKDAIDLAGGIDGPVGASEVELKRGPKNSPTLILLNLSTSGSKPLEPGDVLTVPKKSAP